MCVCVFLFQVRNLMLSTTEETLLQEFSCFKPGSVLRVKKLTDYAFVHYCCREDAVTAASLMNGAQIDGATVEVMLAKPATVRDRSGGKRRSGSLGKNTVGGAGADTLLLQDNNGDQTGRDGCSPLTPVSLLPPLGNPFYMAGAGEAPLSSVSCLRRCWSLLTCVPSFVSGQGQGCVPVVPHRPPVSHQPAVPQTGSDGLGRQPPRLLLPQAALGAAPVSPVLHSWAGSTAARLQGLWPHPLWLVANVSAVPRPLMCVRAGGDAFHTKLLHTRQAVCVTG